MHIKGNISAFRAGFRDNNNGEFFLANPLSRGILCSTNFGFIVAEEAALFNVGLVGSSDHQKIGRNRRRPTYFFNYYDYVESPLLTGNIQSQGRGEMMISIGLGGASSHVSTTIFRNNFSKFS